jgi:hypothetical protein
MNSKPMIAYAYSVFLSIKPINTSNKNDRFQDQRQYPIWYCRLMPYHHRQLVRPVKNSDTVPGISLLNLSDIFLVIHMIVLVFW